MSDVEFALLRKLLSLQIRMHLWRGKIIACFIKGYLNGILWMVDVDDEEILFVCWGEGGFNRVGYS
ncbi:MAG: hypothetical protein ACTTK1_04255 [Candidatus Cryptobacteroides sp.]